MRKPRFWRLQLLGALFVVALVGLFASRLTGVLGSVFLRTAVASRGVVETAFTGKGLLVRSEIPVRSPTSGVVTLLVENGQRVPAGQIVAEVREDLSGETAEALNAVDARIATLDREAQRAADELRLRLADLEQRIAEAERELAAAVSAGLTDAARQVGQYLQQLRGAFEDTNREFAALRAAREAERASLVRERNDLLRNAAANVTVLRTTRPGVVSYYHDGLEEAFRPGQADDEALWSAVDASVSVRQVYDGMPVEAGDTLFRLIDNFVAYVFVRFEEPPSLAQGQTVWLRWPGVAEPGVRARVQSVHNRVGQVGVWFTVEAYDERFDALRVLGNVTVATSRVEGVVVPRRAVILSDGRPGVYLMAEGMPVFRYVEVLAADERRAVVDRVPAGTRVILNPRRLLRSAEAY